MIGTRVRKIISDVWSRKARTLLVSASIFIGVFGVVTLFSTGELLINQLEKDIQLDRLAMVRMQVSTIAGGVIDNDASLATLAEYPGVTAVEGRALYPLFWKLPDETRFRDGILGAYAQPFGETQLEPPRLIDGDWPADGSVSVAIERRMAEKYDLGIGDSIDMRVLSEAGYDGATPQTTGDGVRYENWTISGIFFQPYPELAGAGPVEPDSLVLAPYDGAQHIADFTGLSVIYARFVDYGTADSEAANFQAAVADNSAYVPVFTIIEDPDASPLIEATRSTNQILVMLAMVALVVSGFLVINVINAIVSEQKRQIGVMKSLGATRFDNFFIYSGIALTYGLIGVIPGVLLGIPGGYFGAKGLAEQNNTLIENFAIAPTGIILGAVVGLAVPFLASLVPVINGTRVTILDAMTDFGIESDYGHGPFARFIRALPLPLTLRQALNNVNQKKFRLALTGTTLTIAVGAFMGIFAVFSELGGVIDDVFAIFGSQASISPNEGLPLEKVRDLLVAEEFQAQLEAKGLPRLRSVEPGANLSIEIEGYDPPPVSGGPPGIFAFGFNSENPDEAKFSLNAGDAWNNDPTRRGVVISSRIADLMGKNVGDSVVLLGGGSRDEYEIIGITNYPFDTVWMRWQDLSTLAGMVLGAPTAADYAMGTTYVDLSPAGEGDTVEGDGVEVGALGLDGEFVNFLSYLDGEAPVPGASEVIINSTLAEAEGYEPGDTVTVTLGGHSADYTVSGVFELPAQAAANPNHPTEVAGIYWQELAALDGRSLEGELYPNQINIQFDTDGDPDADTVDLAIEEMNERLIANGITSDFTNWVAFKGTITQFIQVFNVILNLAAGLIAAVGALGLLTSLSMSVFERQKEIGVMRSVGASSWTVAIQFLVEGLVIGLVAWLIGIPFSYFLGQGLIAALPFENFDIGFPVITLIVGLVGMLLVVTIASLWPSLSAARRTVSDILRYQ